MTTNPFDDMPTISKITIDDVPEYLLKFEIPTPIDKSKFAFQLGRVVISKALKDKNLPVSKTCYASMGKNCSRY